MSFLAKALAGFPKHVAAQWVNLYEDDFRLQAVMKDDTRDAGKTSFEYQDIL
ncbi:MAG: hypothetical protein ABI378_11585 [Chitinophagaceae bacterium]